MLRLKNIVGLSKHQLVGILLLVGLLALIISCARKENSLLPIRIGWQVAWATQGQIAETLKHTNILELNGLKGEFTGFSYGPPLNEAALAGQVDVGFVADQPAASLIARGGKFKIVARLMDFRLGIIVPAESEVRDVGDLRGKTIAIPFGSTTHRIVLGMLRNAGLNPEKDLKIINLDITEQAGVVLAGDKKKWRGNIDALASWDPNIAIFESKGLARVLKQDLGLAVVYMSEDFIKKSRKAAISFLKAYVEAYYYYAISPREADRWFVEEARIQFDPSILRAVASFEPNLRARRVEDVDVALREDHLRIMEEGAEFGYKLKLTAVKPDMRAAVDNTILSDALMQIRRNPLNLKRVEVR